MSFKVFVEREHINTFDTREETADFLSKSLGIVAMHATSDEELGDFAYTGDARLVQVFQDEDKPEPKKRKPRAKKTETEEVTD